MRQLLVPKTFHPDLMRVMSARGGYDTAPESPNNFLGGVGHRVREWGVKRGEWTLLQSATSPSGYCFAKAGEYSEDDGAPFPFEHLNRSLPAAPPQTPSKPEEPKPAPNVKLKFYVR